MEEMQFGAFSDNSMFDVPNLEALTLNMPEFSNNDVLGEMQHSRGRGYSNPLPMRPTVNTLPWMDGMLHVAVSDTLNTLPHQPYMDVIPDLEPLNELKTVVPGRSRGFSLGSNVMESNDGLKKRRRGRTMSEEEKAMKSKRRLEKNRESARMCRQRKNRHVQTLEAKVKALELENATLKDNQAMNAECEKFEFGKKAILDEIAALDLIRDKQELVQLVDVYMKKCIFNEHHVNQTSSTLNGILSEYSVAGENSSSSSLQQSGEQPSSNLSALSDELQLSQQQMGQISHIVSTSKTNTSAFIIQDTISTLRDKIADHESTVFREMKSILRVLSKEQAAQFLLHSRKYKSNTSFLSNL